MNKSSSSIHTSRSLKQLFQLLSASVWIAATMLALLAACGAPDQPVATGEASPASAPTSAPPTPTALPRGGNLTIRLSDDSGTLQPWHPRTRGEEQIIGLIYSGLMRLDATLAPQPDLATGWVASADGRIITFTLRSDAVWHDGRPVTVDDVVFTLDALRALPPSTALLTGLRRIVEEIGRAHV